jgi:hypothetical protein
MRFASLTAALVLVGCANSGDEGMIVLNNTAVAGDTCALTGEAGQAFMSHGQIYAQSNLGYTLTPLIQSRVSTATVGGGTGMTTPVDPLTKTIFLRGADVSLTLKAVSIESGGQYTVTQPETNIAQFSVLFSGSLPPSGTVNVGFEVITPAMLNSIVQMSGANISSQNLNAEVLAEVTIRGDLNGSEIEALPFYYPISVCTDCVVVNLGNACNPFQDGIVDCCTDASNNLICPAPVATTP